MPNNRKSRRQSRQQVPVMEKQQGHGAEPPQPEQTATAALDEVHGPNTPCKEVDTLRQELAKQKSNNQDLQDQLSQLTSSFNELRAKFSEQAPSLEEGKILEDHEGLKEDIRNLQRQLDEQKQQRSNVEKKLKKLQHQHSSCQSKQTAALQKEKDRTLSLEGQLKECKKTLQDREKELAQLQQQLQDPQQQAALEERCNKLHKLLQDTFSHLQEVNAKHQQEMEKKDGDLKLMHQQLVDLRDKTRERELALERLKGLLVHSMEQDPLETLNQESSTEPAGPQKEEDDFSSPPAPEDVSSAEPAGPREEQEDFSSPPAPEDVSSAEPAGPRRRRLL
ncbi:uncharacterized protein V6R79_008074 [Siganus canaliculatus]